MRSAEEWFSLYGESHQNPKNKLIHWVFIPPIALSTLGLCAAIPHPFGEGALHWGVIGAGLTLFFYASLSWTLTPGRGGFTPGLSLSYSSGAGNGPFGLGWQLGLPSVRRKTDRGLPRYLDLGEKADTYVLSDVEDLVPLLVLDGEDWVPVTRDVSEGDDTWTVQRFRPRIEGAFALIERWRRASDHRTWWRTRSRENTERVYGRSDQARLTDPDELNNVLPTADPDLVKALNRQLLALRTCAGPTCRVADSLPD